MTDHEILELLLKKISGIDERMTNMEKNISGIKSKLDIVYNHVTKLTEDLTMRFSRKNRHTRV